MRKFFAIIFISFITLGLFISTADAGRFGGGRSFGMSRSASSFTRSNATQNFARGQPFRQNSSSMSRWFGPLAGLAAGGLLASLFMGHGMASGIMSWLLVCGLLFVAITFLRNRMRPAAFTKPTYNNYQDNFARSSASQFMNNQNYTSSSAPTNSYPVGFDPQIFLRDAKVSFMRLQAAYDQKNLNDIREFTTPEVFAEIQLQLQERGNAENVTNVISIEAELLNVENETQMISGTEMETQVASARFIGMVQEEKNASPVSVNEVWHFKKEVGSLRWIVAGVQQN